MAGTYWIMYRTLPSRYRPFPDESKVDCHTKDAILNHIFHLYHNDNDRKQ